MDRLGYGISSWKEAAELVITCRIGCGAHCVTAVGQRYRPAAKAGFGAVIELVAADAQLLDVGEVLVRQVIVAG